MSISSLHSTAASNAHAVSHTTTGTDAFTQSHNLTMGIISASGLKGSVQGDISHSGSNVDFQSILNGCSTGSVWTIIAASAAFTGQTGYSFVVFGGKMWVYGGLGIGKNVYSSTDGITWTNVTSTAGYTARSDAGSLVFNGKMWIFGGVDGSSNYLNDVWSSSDGATWTQATATAAWAGRAYLSTYVFGGKIWLHGGYTGAVVQSDTWSSSDGATWTQTSSSGPSRLYHCGAVFGGKMWVYGGTDGGTGLAVNSVYSTQDGVTWSQATASAAWGIRNSAKACIFNGAMWVMGGQNGSGTYLRDVWYSYDGATWIQATSTAAWGVRAAFGLLIYDNSMWVIAGQTTGTAVVQSIYRTAFDFQTSVYVGLIDARTGSTMTLGSTATTIAIPANTRQTSYARINAGLTNNSTRPAFGATSTPIQGEIRGVSNGGDSNDDGFLRLRSGGGTTSTAIAAIDISGSSNVSDMNSNVVLYAAGSEKLRVNTNGVSINGNTGSNFPFSVKANVAADCLALFNSSNAAKWHVALTTDDFNLVETGVADGRIYVAAGGHVGINNNAPGTTYALNVTGTVFTSGGYWMSTTGGNQTLGLNFFESNNAVAIPFTGPFSSSPVFYFTKLGNLVICYLPTIQGTSTSAALLNAAAGSIPSRYRPVQTHRPSVNCLNSGVQQTNPCSFEIKSDGSITIYRDFTGSTWSSGGTAGPFGLYTCWATST